MSFVAIYEFLSTALDIVGFLICFFLYIIYDIAWVQLIAGVADKDVKRAIKYNLVIILCYVISGYVVFVSRSLGGIIGMCLGGSLGVFISMKRDKNM